ncbi:hypothetical protein HK100_011632 [Physocladia obscura]|uniref:DUF4097 domain-containing protein n=1 Tax=Physocladia obscura TaxID=109957 RepID=A0AAD5T6X9_9FUNG|nr:hypothetical protein HK100_011632 [Physocladia obscura]
MAQTIPATFDALSVTTQGPGTVELTVRKGNDNKHATIETLLLSGPSERFKDTQVSAVLSEERLNIIVKLAPTVAIGSLSISLVSLKIAIIISLPNDIKDFISNMNTGSLKIQDINFTRFIDLKSSTGSIACDTKLETESLLISSSTGSIHVASCFASKFLALETSTGKITSGDITSAGINLKAVTGKIEVTRVESSTDLCCESSTGSILLDNVVAESITASTGTGKIIVTKGILTKNAMLTTNTGSIQANFAGYENLACTTGTGEIKLVLTPAKLSKSIVQVNTGAVDVTCIGFEGVVTALSNSGHTVLKGTNSSDGNYKPGVLAEAWVGGEKGGAAFDAHSRTGKCLLSFKKL